MINEFIGGIIIILIVMIYWILPIEHVQTKKISKGKHCERECGGHFSSLLGKERFDCHNDCMMDTTNIPSYVIQ